MTLAKHTLKETDVIRIHPLLQTSLEISRAPSNELLWNLTRHGGKFLEEIYQQDGLDPEWFGTERVLFSMMLRRGAAGLENGEPGTEVTGFVLRNNPRICSVFLFRVKKGG